MNDKPKQLGTDWTNYRAEELKALQTLLCEVRTINHGGGACERIKQCEDLAKLLSDHDLDLCRPSFLQFLMELAYQDRFPEPPQSVKDHARTLEPQAAEALERDK